jgi:Arc/MetJ family transcription regulator
VEIGRADLEAGIRLRGIVIGANTPKIGTMVYSRFMRTNIEIDDNLIRKARKLTHLRTKREIVHEALDRFVKSEERKGILRYFGSGIWEGDLKSMRRNRL